MPSKIRAERCASSADLGPAVQPCPTSWTQEWEREGICASSSEFSVLMLVGEGWVVPPLEYGGVGKPEILAL